MSAPEEVAVSIVFIVLGVATFAFALYVLFDDKHTGEPGSEDCPAGGLHEWKYERHFLDLTHWYCQKCGGEKSELADQNKINWLEYEKRKAARKGVAR